jgi:hypothetical protein
MVYGVTAPASLVAVIALGVWSMFLVWFFDASLLAKPMIASSGGERSSANATSGGRGAPHLRIENLGEPRLTGP